MRRKIYTQGDLDAACFLYSLANAYTALTGKTPELTRWDEAITKIMRPIDFQLACVGTTDHYARNPSDVLREAEAVLDALTGEKGSLIVSKGADITSLDRVAGLISPSSVAVLWYKGNTRYVQNEDHWVCAVATEESPTRIHVACSIRRADDGSINNNTYIETEHAAIKRYSNDWIEEGMACRILPEFVLKIERADWI